MENIFNPDCDCTLDPDYCGCTYIIRNINKGCDSFRDGVSDLDIAVGYKHLSFGWDKNSCPWSGCLAPTGWLRIGDFENLATIEFSVLPSMDCSSIGSKKIKDVFYGKRND